LVVLLNTLLFRTTSVTLWTGFLFRSAPVKEYQHGSSNALLTSPKPICGTSCWPVYALVVVERIVPLSGSQLFIPRATALASQCGALSAVAPSIWIPLSLGMLLLPIRPSFSNPTSFVVFGLLNRNASLQVSWDVLYKFSKQRTDYKVMSMIHHQSKQVIDS